MTWFLYVYIRLYTGVVYAISFVHKVYDYYATRILYINIDVYAIRSFCFLVAAFDVLF